MLIYVAINNILIFCLKYSVSFFLLYSTLLSANESNTIIIHIIINYDIFV